MKNKTLLIILKTIISISLLTYIILKVEWNEVFNKMWEANLFFILIVFLLFILEQVELTYKWNLLINARGIKVSLFRLYLINAIGTFWGMFLPSSVGTDVVRGYYLVKNNSERSVSVSSIFVDRIGSLLSLILFVLIFIFTSGDIISGLNITNYVLLFSLAVLISVYFFQMEKTSVVLNKLVKKSGTNKILNQILKLHQSILEYKKHPRALLSSFFVSLLVQITRVVIYYFITLAFNISVPIIYFFLFIPLIMIVLMIPISIGGLGVREGAFIAFFSLVGLTINEAATITLTTSLMVNLMNLIGGLAYLFYGSTKKIEQKAAAT